MIGSNIAVKDIALSSNITYPIFQGTPMDKDGKVANSGKAVGIMLDTLTEAPLMGRCYIAIAGRFDLAELEAASRLTYTNACKKALSKGLHIVDSSLETASAGVPESTADDSGKHLVVGEDGNPTWTTVS